ncbi:MAG: DUF1846 domain-containing protein [Candidatus Thermoplasmatota archaeon]|nr:DUF1846 domain-containing protein [Euryarchaeota archaeon]MBU4072149.1 DUF1846 domain-containing protein [Candidatus Thermoplasmatota archaeon]MBU4143654.1 DUF1846 domain-containing protein [Candidatus Thermoplasmatota archaeon]MBU4592458.1 DUF1846 domain-containing protein [Candidatus Thermoplasmatota archaeon]
MEAGFDNEKYLREQTKAIMKRVDDAKNKLYLEFGGKIIYDYHASRVLPGFDPNVKMRLLRELKDNADIILCIYAGDIERRKVRADFGITYDADAMKLIDDLRAWDIEIAGVVITRFQDQPAVNIFKNKLERRDIRVYTHTHTKGYPSNVDLIVSDEGYGANPYIQTEKPLVIVTGPGPGSGKLATCLSQLYHDYRNGIKSGYSKFETFPIWNIPLDHPVNVAYEAATADIGDFNMIDPYHQKAYNIETVNYNRDVEVFPVLRSILEKIMETESPYQSPTDMGVNMAGFGIVDDDIVRWAAKQEIIRRVFRYNCEYMKGFVSQNTVKRAEDIMSQVGVNFEDRAVVLPARRAAEDAVSRPDSSTIPYCGAAIQLKDGRIITGKNSLLLHAASSMVLNTIKILAEIPDRIHLLSPGILASIGVLETKILGERAMSLDLNEALVALSISAAANPTAHYAMERLSDLRGCEVHLTHMPSPGDETGLRRLGVNLTSDPEFSTRDLHYG